MLDPYRAALIDAVQDEGMQRALSFARPWVEVADEALLDLARSGRHFCADDLLAEVGPAPSPGATGAVFKRAARAGIIEPIGFTTSQRLSRHGGVQRLWRGLHA